MMQPIQPYQEYQLYQPLEVQVMWFQNLVFVLLAIGMIVYFFKKGPSAFFEDMWGK